jgi:DNA-binding MarR family transcriptional regulator
MADINSRSGLLRLEGSAVGTEARPRQGAPGEDAELMALVELLFFAYRDFTSDPDAILAGLELGRAHHRVLHFVHRNPGLRVADLLEILKITKQSLARVLRQLIDKGYIEQRTGAEDRRERLLFATPKGDDLADRLAAPQLARIATALAAVGADASHVTRTFLYNMITPSERAAVDAIMGAAGSRRKPTDVND